MTPCARIGFLCAVFAAVSTPAAAQWVSQSVRLQPGWNAVFLEVVPQPDDPDALFASIPVESVWMWNRKFRAAQFLADPESLLPDDPDWLAYFPPDSPSSAATSLHALAGGKSYLVKLAGARAVQLTLTGLPIARPPAWIADSFNFVGFAIDPATPPTFSEFFDAEKAHQGQKIFRLNDLGKWAESAPDNPMTPGEAFWTYCRGASTFQGPVTTSLRVGGLLNFDRLTDQLSLTLRNRSAQERTLRLEPAASASPPGAASPVVAGEVPLSYFEQDVPDPSSIGEWRTISSAQPLSVNLPPRGERTIRLIVRRSDMAPPPTGKTFLYQSLLKITDGRGSRILAPLRAEGIEGEAVASARTGIRGQFLPDPATAQTPSPPPLAGLWVGTAVFTHVSHPANVADRTRLEPASGEFPIRLLLHLDSAGKARLLQQVALMSKTENDDTRLVLVTDDALLPQFDGVFERDGALVGQRISSAAFPLFHVADEPAFTLPQVPGGAFENGDAASTETLQFLLRLSYDDPLNPFVHRYHPDHDNLDPNYEPWDPAIIDGRESWSIERLITLTFTPSEPGVASGRPSPDWLATRVGGAYREELRGVYRTDWNRSLATPIVMAGRFELTRLSTVGVLNDGQ